MEDVSKRTAQSKTFRNPDGSFTDKVTAVPRHYRTSTGWADIDNGIVTDAGGGYRNRANSFVARFKPSAVSIEAAEGTVTVTPTGRTLPAPTVDAPGETVTYPEVWPGVDVRYRVEATGVKEELVLNRRPAASEFDFAIQGTRLTPDGAGGLAAGGAFAGKWSVLPPVVFDKDGMAVPEAAPRLSVSGDTVRLSVDPLWLAGLTDADFPVVLDPTWSTVGGPNSQAYYGTPSGYSTCAPCQVLVGNPTPPGWPTWRSTVYFPYEHVIGKQVLAAQVDLYDFWEGTTEPQLIKVFHGSWNWLDLGTYVGEGIATDEFILNTEELRAFYDNATGAGYALKFLGVEDYSNYSYKRFGAFQLTLLYNDGPSVASPIGPSNGALLHNSDSLAPTLSVSPSSDPDDDPVSYYFRLATGPDAESGVVDECGWQLATACPVGPLNWNTTYYWKVSTFDGIWRTDPNWVWSFRPVNSGPPVPAPSSPAADAVLAQTNLSFTSGTVSDPDGDPVSYQFQVATGADGQSGRLAMSQWITPQAGQTPTWSPPPGTFADGGSYSWIVRTQDNNGATSGWSAPRGVKIDFRLGHKPTLPYDSAGPASVNLSNGNLVVSVPGPSFPTVGGPVGVSFTYNSQAPVVRGLAGDYYQDTNANGVLDSGDPRLLHRIDPQLSFEWGSPGEGPNSAVLNPERWIARWTGSIRVPAGQDGSWVFVSDTSDDSLKVTAAGNVVLNATSPGVKVVGSPVTLSSSSSTPIQVDYVRVTGPEYLHLKIRKASDPDTVAFDIPSDWLTPTQPSLPDGWSRTGDGLAQAAYTALRPVNGATTAVVDDSGADHLYSWSGSGWKPPAGENGVLTQRPDGTWSLLGEDGYLYRFSVEGRLSDITSPADDTRPGAPSYLYGTPNPGGPVRLTRITDATGRKVELTYGPSGSCPTATGFDTSAPADMVCKIAYTDFGGGATELYYSNGHLARITSYTGAPGTSNPKGDTLDFGYNSDGLLTQIRDILTNDLIGAGVVADPAADTHKWLFAYDTDPIPAKRKVISLKAPIADAAMTDSARPLRSYVYSHSSGLPTRTDVQVASGNGPGGYARRVVLDAHGHATSDFDAAGIAVDIVWDLKEDRPTKKIDHHYQADAIGGLVTTSFYDAAGRLTDSYGPAPASEFDAQGRSTTAPHTTSAYDEGIDGLAAAWYDNPELAGVPKAHSTSAAKENWDVRSPAAGIPADGFSGRLTGEVTLPQDGTLTLTADGGRVVVDDQVLTDTWGGPYPAAAAADKPLSYWRFRETSGTRAADSTTFANGTFFGGVTLGAAGNLAAEPDTAADFGGVSGHVALPGGFSDFSGGLTIEAWVYPTANSFWGRIVDFGNGPSSDNILFARAGATNDLAFHVYRAGTATGVTAPGVLVNNTWQHLAVTMTGAGEVTIYKNGVAVASGSVSPPNVIHRANNYIARSNWAGDSYMAGKLDEVAVYRSALSASRIAAHANAAAQTTSTTTTIGVTAGTHRLRVDYQELTGNATLQLTSSVAGATFKPRYNLLTTATDADGKVTKHQYLPESGLETATIADPGGATLRTTTTYEPAGTGYLRRLSRRLPGNDAGYTATVLTDGPAGYWRMGETSGSTFADSSGSGRPATINGAMGYASASVAAAATDGGAGYLGGYASVADSPGVSFSGPFTLEGWVRLTTTASQQGLIEKYTAPGSAGYALRIVDGRLQAWTVGTSAAASVTGATTLTPGVAYHVAATYDGATLRLYLNGAQDGSVATTVAPSDGSATLKLGARGDDAALRLSGTFDEVAVYPQALSAGRLLAHYQAGTATTGAVTSTYYGDTEVALSNTCGVSGGQAGALKQTIEVDPDGTGPQTALVRSYVYDPAGRQAGARLGSEAWTCTTYDARGRVVSQIYPAYGTEPARTVTTNYAVGGNPAVTSVTDTTGTIITTTDWLGRVTSYRDVWGNTTTTSYDQAGRVTDTAGPAGAHHFEYDPSGRGLSAQSFNNVLVATPTYDTNSGLMTTVAYPAGVGNGGNGTSLTISRDNRGRTSGLNWKRPDGSVFASDAVTRSADGRVMDQKIDGVDPNPGGANFTYDGAGRLTDAWLPGHHYTYSFAVSGGCGPAASAGANTNRTATTDNGAAPTTYCYDLADRLVSTNDSRYGSISYDGHGNTTTLGSQSLVYDMADRHQQTTTGPTTVRYVRDATDRIVERADGTTVTRYGYSAAVDIPDLTLDAANTVIERAVALPGGALLTKRTTGDVWSYPNLHGDVMATTDAAGTKQGTTLTYDPYGQTLGAVADNSAGNLDYAWLGQHQRPLEHEATLTTIEMGARQYIPGLGRFLEVDPIEGGSCSDYDYVCGDPINNFDLNGENAAAIAAGTGAALTCVATCAEIAAGVAIGAVTVGTVVVVGTGVKRLVNWFSAEHTKNARSSTEGKHQEGKARAKADKERKRQRENPPDHTHRRGRSCRRCR